MNDSNTPSVLLAAMARRRAAGLFVEIVQADHEKAFAAGVGVMSMYAKDEAQRDAYIGRLQAAGVRYTVSAS
jgi:hypothetical protein